MKKALRYIEHILDQTVYLLPYCLMGVSFLYVLIPKIFGISLDYMTWGNGGGFSILCDILFIKEFFFKKRYCWLTRHLPFALLFINIFNIISNKFFSAEYRIYEQWYEIIIFSIILSISLILWLKKITKDIYGNYITQNIQ